MADETGAPRSQPPARGARRTSRGRGVMIAAFLTIALGAVLMLLGWTIIVGLVVLVAGIVALAGTWLRR